MLKLSQMRAFLLLLISLSIIIPSYAFTPMEEEARAYRDEGYKLQSMGDWQGALSFYQKAVEMDPLFVEGYNDLGVVYENNGDDASALRMYKRALEIDSSYLPTYTNLAFYYENRGDIENATKYWAKRYDMGQEGEYWREVALQHLLVLGTYPDAKKQWLEKKAARLSQNLIYEREQERLKTIEEARLHFNIGCDLLGKGDYLQSMKEFETAFGLNPQDEELLMQIAEFYEKSFMLYKKDKAIVSAQGAIDAMRDDDFLSSGDQLKESLDAVFQVIQKDIRD